MTAACAAGWCAWMAIQDGDPDAPRIDKIGVDEWADVWLAQDLPDHQRHAFMGDVFELFMDMEATRHEVVVELDRIAAEYGL